MRRLLLLVPMLALCAAAAAWALRSGPVSSTRGPLTPRAAPDAACTFTPTLDRERDDGQPVQFGDLRCPGAPIAATMRTGEAWFELPAHLVTSPYNGIRRTPDNVHWVVFADGRTTFEVFRSDDGGRSFICMGLVQNGLPLEAMDFEASGDRYEHLGVQLSITRSRFRVFWETVREAPTDWRAAIEVARWVWSSPPAARSINVPMVSHDGGASWNEQF